MRVYQIKVGAKIKLKKNLFPKIKVRNGVIVHVAPGWSRGQYYLIINREGTKRGVRNLHGNYNKWWSSRDWELDKQPGRMLRLGDDYEQ